jgi:hypothetical protein
MAPLDQLTDRVSAALWNLHPVWAVRLGKHEYDGQLPDLSAGALAGGYERLRRLREQLAVLPALTPAQEIDRTVLLAVVDVESLAGEGPTGWQQNPARYLEPIAIESYLGRDYAPTGLRLERAAAVLEGAGEVLAAARANLDPVLGREMVEWAVARAGRIADCLEAGPAAVGGAPDPGGEARLREASAIAVREVRAYADWLEEERLPRAGATGPFGAEVVERLLWDGGPPGRTPTEVAEIARRALAEDRAGLGAATAGPAPGGAASPPAFSPGELPGAIEEAAGFVRRSEVVTIPEEMRLAVVEDPRLPAGRARLDLPGPYDDPGVGAVIHVASPAGTSPAGSIHDLAVTGGYPGRLLAARWKAAVPGEVRRRFAARGFEEGWALYAGEAMWEAGYRRNDPAWRQVWLDRARRADCRLVCALGVHGGEMTLEQAEVFFMEQAGCDQGEARREAARVAIDPGCGSAALGRWEILDRWHRWAAQFPAAGPADFHDALLAGGAPPLGLLAEGVLP